MQSLNDLVALKIGVMIGLLHFIAVFSISYTLLSTEVDAQWQLIWIPFWFLDFPISLASIFSPQIFGTINSPFTTYPASEVHDFLIPLIIHGIFGSLWWTVLPIFFLKIFKYFKLIP